MPSATRLFVLYAITAFHFVGTSVTNADEPIEVVQVTPIEKASFNNDGKCPERRQGGNPHTVDGRLVFDGSTDGDRQVDPQIAVGPNHVFHGTNSGLIIYDKQGNFVQGVSQDCFNNGIDPKLFYDAHNQIYGFNLWTYWDDEKLKPANIAVSKTSDPTKAWRILPVSIPQGVDGGGIGYSRKWIGYSYPGGDRCTFVIRTADAIKEASVNVYFFGGSLGHPVYTQDPVDDLYFFHVTDKKFELKKVTEVNGAPVSEDVFSVPHHLEYIGYPPQSPQMGTDKPTASGDRNPKNIVLQNDHLWFSQTVNCEGRAAVQWHQVALDGTIVQTGLIRDPKSSFIQTTIAVNKRNDLLVGFQETSPDMFISPRMAYRLADDPLGKLRDTISIGEGRYYTEGGPWGDYSGSVVDGENFLDLWTIQSIADDKGQGDTVISRIELSKDQ